MSPKLKAFAVAVLLSFSLADSALAFVWDCVPEFDGTGSIAAISLLLSVGAVLFSGARSR